MRRLTTTIVLLVVLGGLVGYIYFVDSRNETPDPNAKPKAFELTADNVEELQFKNPDGQTARVQRTGDNWQLLEPVKADADNGVVGTVTSNLSTLEVQRVVEESPADLAQYGLTGITRLSVSPRGDAVAVVAVPASPGRGKGQPR